MLKFTTCECPFFQILPPNKLPRTDGVKPPRHSAFSRNRFYNLGECLTKVSIQGREGRVRAYPRNAWCAFQVWPHSGSGCGVDGNDKECGSTPGICRQACSIPDYSQEVCSGSRLPPGNQAGSELLPNKALNTDRQKAGGALPCAKIA